MKKGCPSLITAGQPFHSLGVPIVLRLLQKLYR